ncbi:unnamed protein product [Calypogeia fissa]
MMSAGMAMASLGCSTSSVSRVVGLCGHGLANSSSRSSVFGRRFSPSDAVAPRRVRASPASLICVAVTWWSDASREILPDWKKVQKLRVEKRATNQSTDDVPPVEIKDVSLWENVKSGAQSLFSAGFTPEVVIGRTAMLGFLSATTVEFETGKSVLQQLTFRGDILAMVVAVGVLLMSLRRKDEDGSVATFNPSGMFTPTAERLNGQAAMLGFALLVVIESAKGSALF